MPRSPPPRKQNYPSNPHPLEKISGSVLAVQHFGVGGLGWGGGATAAYCDPKPSTPL